MFEREKMPVQKRRFKINKVFSNKIIIFFSLIHKMLQREPIHRAKLEDILNHQWLCMGDYIAPTVPLISREHLSDEDHNYLIDKMVEGSIATKEEILQ